VHPPLRAPGRDSCLGDANISEKDIDAFVLNFKEDVDASDTYSNGINLYVGFENWKSNLKLLLILI